MSSTKVFEEISLREKVSYGIGAVGKDAACSIVYTFLMVYLTDVVGLAAAFVGILFLVARLWDAFNDPIMGWIVDNTKTKYGKFRPWILLGTLVNSLIVALLFWNPAGHMSETAVYVWCSVFYILWGMSYTVMDIPYWSMIPSFSRSSAIRDQMSVIPRTGALLGGQAVNIFGIAIIAALGTGLGGTESDGFFRLTLGIIVVFIICETICVINVREHITTVPKEKIRVKDVFLLLAKNDQLLAIIVATILQQLAGFLVSGMAIYFFKYVIGDESLFAYFMGFGATGALIAYLGFPLFVRLTSRKIVYISSCLLAIIGNLGMFIFGTDSTTAATNLVLASNLIANIGNSLTMVSTTVMLADTVDYGEFKLGTRSESIVFSMQTMTVKAGSALAGCLGGVVLSCVGYIPNVSQTPETLLGLRISMFLVSSVLLLLVIGIYLKFYKLNGVFYKNILNTLEITRPQSNHPETDNLQNTFIPSEQVKS